MKSTLITKENNEAKFTMEFSAEEFEQAVVAVYKRSKNDFAIDGFRKGKVPRSIIEKKYGEDIFFEEAVNDLMQKSYPEAIKELELEVIDAPKLDISEIKKGQGFTVTADVALYPVVEVKDYKGVEIEQIDPEITDENVDYAIDEMRKRNARIEVAERAAETGDTVILDYSGSVDGEKFDGGTAERQELKLGSGMFIPGFEEQLVGVKPGESKDVKVSFPEEYHAEDLAGKEAIFQCTVHEVKEEILPEADDEFAKDVSEFDTLEELKEDTKENMQKTAEEQMLNMAKDMAVQKVAEANPIDVPKAMTEDEIDRMMQQLNQELGAQGASLQMYLQMMGKEMNEFRESLRDEAEKKVATRIVLMSIVEKENVEATEEEVETELQNVADAYGMEKEQVRGMIGVDNMTYFMKDIQLKKVIDLIYDAAKITMISQAEKEKEMEEKLKQQKEEAAKEEKTEDK